MLQVQVEPHTDGIGGHQAVDLAGLVESHLRIARARAQGAQHHGAPAAQRADALGKRVDRFGGEGDDGVAGLQPRHLAMSFVRERGEPRPAREPCLGHQGAKQRPHGVRAEEHGLRAPPRAQQAVGEDVAALAVAGELYLVDGDELDPAVERHRFDGADEVARIGRDPLLLARHQRDGALPLLSHDAVVDFAREESKREAHHAGAVGQHALDRQVGLARVGRAKQRGDGGAFGVVPSHGGRIGAPAPFGNPDRGSGVGARTSDRTRVRPIPPAHLLLWWRISDRYRQKTPNRLALLQPEPEKPLPTSRSTRS